MQIICIDEERMVINSNIDVELPSGMPSFYNNLTNEIGVELHEFANPDQQTI